MQTGDSAGRERERERENTQDEVEQQGSRGQCDIVRSAGASPTPPEDTMPFDPPGQLGLFKELPRTFSNAQPGFLKCTSVPLGTSAIRFDDGYRGVPDYSFENFEACQA